MQEHWARLGSPQRPNGEVVAAFREQIASVPGKTLLLGVTPELADIGADITAVDRHEGMLNYIWPGDTAKRHAHLGDWRSLQLGSGVFDHSVGDGSLNALTFPDDIIKVMQEVKNALRPGGRLVCRLYATPDPCETLDEVYEAVMNRRIQSFHALKWRLAMAVVAANGQPNIAVTEILQCFERLFPDRHALAAHCGWQEEIIGTIDAYRNSRDVYCFPTATQFLSLVPEGFINPRIVAAGTYELAERCPLLVADRAP